MLWIIVLVWGLVWLVRPILLCLFVSFCPVSHCSGKCPCNILIHFFFIDKGLTTSTLTSPLWVVKTRLQLESRFVVLHSTYSWHISNNIDKLIMVKLLPVSCSFALFTPLVHHVMLVCSFCCSAATKGQIQRTVQNILTTDGIRGFYRGLSATYIGITETCLHFVIYEHIKAELQQYNSSKRTSHEKHITDFFQFMLAAATSKCTASVVAYPHEVIRTRLRQQELDGKRRYRSFFQAFRKIAVEEGWRGLYGGLKTHLLRQVPNTAVMFLTYEAIVSCLCPEE